MGLPLLLELPIGSRLSLCCSNKDDRHEMYTGHRSESVILSLAPSGELVFQTHHPPIEGGLPTLVSFLLFVNRIKSYITSLLRRLMTSSASDFFLNVMYAHPKPNYIYSYHSL